MSQFLINPYAFVTPIELLLDTYTGAAGAYSLRKLRTAYTGSAIRVRRSNDNAEQDIGFDGNGNLDESALTTFVGANSGFVTTWYDQSGNGRNATQTTSGNQPRIVNSGTVDKEGGKPTIVFDGTNDSLLSTTAIDPLFVSVVNTPNTTANFKSLIGADTSASGSLGAFYFQYASPTRVPRFARITTASTLNVPVDMFVNGSQVSNQVKNLLTGIRTDTTINLFTNSTSQGSGSTVNPLKPVGGADTGKFRIGAAYFNDAVVDFFPGSMQEVILYTSDQSTNRTGIETNINGYYSIY
jgi:hypothetical protein